MQNLDTISFIVGWLCLGCFLVGCTINWIITYTLITLNYFGEIWDFNSKRCYSTNLNCFSGCLADKWSIEIQGSSRIFCLSTYSIIFVCWRYVLPINKLINMKTNYNRRYMRWNRVNNLFQNTNKGKSVNLKAMSR